jgi:hypothetical protein
LTPIRRQSGTKERKYYICTTYNTKGKRYCKKAHLIEEADLMDDVVTYVKLCRNALCEVIATYDLKDFESEKKSVEEKRQEVQSAINERKAQLKVLFAQKIRDLSGASGNEDLINESYDSLQNDILAQIHGLEIQLKELNETSLETPDVKEKLKNALDVVDKIIANGVLNRKDIEILIERIDVDENGLPEITLKYGLSNLIEYSPAEELNRRENEIIYHTLRLIKEDDRGFTSAKYLSAKLTELGYSKSKKSVLTYIGLMLHMGVVEKSDNPLKPYTIIKSSDEIQELMHEIYESCRPNAGDVTGSLLTSDSTLHSDDRTTVRDRMTTGHEVHDECDENLHGYGVNRWNAGDGF